MKTLSCTFILLLLTEIAFGAEKKDTPKGATEVAIAPPQVMPLTRCTSEISYKWRRSPPSSQTETSTGGKRAKGATLPNSSTHTDPEIYEPLERHALSITESGEIESEVKARVEAQIPTALTKAMSLCIDHHQNEGGCLTKKLGTVLPQIDRLDFETKKEIRERSIEDCQKEQGICISALNSEISCRQEVLPTPIPTEAPTASAKESKKK